MLATRVIPCLDLRDGRVVKGVRFAALRDTGDPVEVAHRYERQGADEIALLDVSATPDGKAHAIETVCAIRNELSIPLTVGGGVRTTDDAARLFDAGADRVCVNTAAVEQPRLISNLAKRFGAQSVVASVDAARRSNGFTVLTTSGTHDTGLDAVAWSKQCEVLGAGEILLTSWDADGSTTGYELELVADVSSAVRIPVVASGGAGAPEHLVAATEAGANAVLIASIVHDGLFTISDLKESMATAGIEVRR